MSLPDCTPLITRRIPVMWVALLAIGACTDTQTDNQVISAYLALLLSKIIAVVPSAMSDIAQLLPGSDMRTKLGSLLTSLQALDRYRSVLQHTLREQAGSEGTEWQEDRNEVKQAIEDMSRLVNMY
jgi:hypothetical protein